MTTKMSWYMNLLLKLLKETPHEFVEIPAMVPARTVQALVEKDWIQTSPEGDRAKITGRGAVALLTSYVYPNTIPDDVKAAEVLPVVVDEIEEEMEAIDADERPYVIAEQIRPYLVADKASLVPTQNEGEPQNGNGAECEDCENCLPARLLARLKLVNPKIARVIDAWIEAEKALEELK